ncbi:hypothetical protein [Mariniphaga sp.]|uniref:hypothetical protein n=1 Tax=Mariniphaga sp. TaxID=1954475 RepID=UPI003568C102
MTKEELLDLIVSWENLPLLVRQLETDYENLKLLMDLAFENNHPKSWRAAYIADKINDNHPKLIAPFICEMILRLKTEKSSSKKRHYLKIISQQQFSRKYHSLLVDSCLECFTSASEPIANRVHAMQILFNISEKEPGFKSELLSIIEHEIELHPTPGIVSRGKKLVRKLMMQT